MIVQSAKDIGLLIRQRRIELGLDQQSLADRSGVSRQWIIKVEQGKPNAQIGLIIRTIKALDLTVEVTDPMVTRDDREQTQLFDLDAILARKKPGMPE